MSGLFGGRAAPASTNALGDSSKDTQLSSPPEDSISGLSWSPVANYLAVSSWDNKVRIYDITTSKQGTGVAAIDFGGPVLGCDWSQDGQKVVGASSDKTAKLLDLAANGAPAQQIALHDGPIRAIKFVQIPSAAGPMVVTGSWDKTLRYWDLRQSTAVATISLKERVYAMATKEKLLVVALGGQSTPGVSATNNTTGSPDIDIIDLNQPGTIYKTIKSPLKYQTRALTCFKEANGFMVGSTEGRCAFSYLEAKDIAGNMSFKCHRDPVKSNNVNIWTINAVSTHPKYGSFSSAGSDGSFNFWDKESKTRLKTFPGIGGSISATDFNGDGTIFAYAVSYDWHQGYAFNKPDYPNKVMLHAVDDASVKPKKWKG